MINKMIISLNTKDLRDIFTAVAALSTGLGYMISAKEYKKKDKNKNSVFLDGELYGEGIMLASFGAGASIGVLLRSLKLGK